MVIFLLPTNDQIRGTVLQKIITEVHLLDRIKHFYNNKDGSLYLQVKNEELFSHVQKKALQEQKKMAWLFFFDLLIQCIGFLF